MDPECLRLAFEKYPQAKVVVLAHLYGTPAKMDEIIEICKEHNAVIIEDAAEALSATYKDRQCGTFGKYNVISFNGNKIITTSGGGMLITEDEESRKKALYRATQARENVLWYQHEEIGYNYRMSNICAGIGRGQMKCSTRTWLAAAKFTRSTRNCSRERLESPLSKHRARNLPRTSG